MLTQTDLAQVNASVQAVVDASKRLVETVEGLGKPAPWVPRFKVGDRVKLSHRDTDAFGKVSEVLHRERSYRLTNSGFSWLEQDLEPAPPLPDPERERVPLEASDVPPGSVLRKSTEGWEAVVGCDIWGVYTINRNTTTHIKVLCWSDLMKGYSILRPSNTDWQPCSKPSRS